MKFVVGHLDAIVGLLALKLRLMEAQLAWLARQSATSFKITLLYTAQLLGLWFKLTEWRTLNIVDHHIVGRDRLFFGFERLGHQSVVNVPLFWGSLIERCFSVCGLLI